MKKLKYEEGKEEKLIAKRYIILYLDALKLASNPVPLSLCKFLFQTWAGGWGFCAKDQSGNSGGKVRSTCFYKNVNAILLTLTKYWLQPLCYALRFLSMISILKNVSLTFSLHVLLLVSDFQTFSLITEIQKQDLIARRWSEKRIF